MAAPPPKSPRRPPQPLPKSLTPKSGELGDTQPCTHEDPPLSNTRQVGLDHRRTASCSHK